MNGIDKWMDRDEVDGWMDEKMDGWMDGIDGSQSPYSPLVPFSPLLSLKQQMNIMSPSSTAHGASSSPKVVSSLQCRESRYTKSAAA